VEKTGHKIPPKTHFLEVQKTQAPGTKLQKKCKKSNFFPRSIPELKISSLF